MPTPTSRGQHRGAPGDLPGYASGSDERGRRDRHIGQSADHPNAGQPAVSARLHTAGDAVRRGPAGRDLGGIRDLAGIRRRCTVGSTDDDCWLWAGQVAPRKNGVVQVWVRTEGTAQLMTLGRAAWLLSGKPLPPVGGRVWRCCGGGMRCGNPAHLRAGTVAQHGAWLRRDGALRGNVDRSEINRRNSSGRSVITPELAQWVRESTQRGAELAAVLGASQSVISAIRCGTRHVPRVAGSTGAVSVFALGAAVALRARTDRPAPAVIGARSPV